jgi:hypothetical protein
MKNTVINEVYYTPIATILTIALFVNKIFLFHHSFNKDEKGHVDLLKGEKLDVKVHSCVFPWHT